MTPAPFTTLITAEELRELLASRRDVVLLDASFDLGDTGAGEQRYAAGHAPGSLYVHLDRDLSTAKNGRNGRHPLPERAGFATTAGRLGIGTGTQVVAFDGQGGPYAARLWWMLKWLGHDAVAVLDGGVQAWQEAGGTLTGEASVVTARPPYPPATPLVASIDAAAVAARPANDMLLDARSGERFRGESEPIDPVAGHIPGAFNRFHRGNLDEHGRFKPSATLRAEFDTLLAGRPAEAVVHSCGSGVTACHNLLAMAHAGLAGARLYPGSWSEWSSDPARPVARG